MIVVLAESHQRLMGMKVAEVRLNLKDLAVKSSNRMEVHPDQLPLCSTFHANLYLS